MSIRLPIGATAYITSLGRYGRAPQEILVFLPYFVSMKAAKSRIDIPLPVPRC